MRFSYFERLSAKDKRVYLRSDEIRVVKVPDAVALAPLVDELRVTLEAGVRDRAGRLRRTGDRIRATKAANALILALCKQLGAPKVRVRIRETRPSWDGGELHGLYTFAENRGAQRNGSSKSGVSGAEPLSDEDGEVPEIEVWMRTVAKGQIVRFRTFMRTLLHEACHHLDATLFEMPESFHTHGFFARESSLTKQLLGERPMPLQLDLFTRSGSDPIRPKRR